MGTKVYFFTYLIHSLALSALDLGLTDHTIMLVICLPVIAECRIEIRVCVAVCYRREVCRCLPSFQHSEGGEVHPELIRRLETSGQQIRIASAVVCRIKYRRQIDALIDPIRDGLWTEPCIYLRCDGAIDQQIVDVRPWTLGSAIEPVLGQHSRLRAGVVHGLDSISLADIHAQIDERFICRVTDRPVSASL